MAIRLRLKMMLQPPEVFSNLLDQYHPEKWLKNAQEPGGAKGE
jgi:hypothetical protein